MKIDVSKIEGYETMSAEEKLQALEGYEFEEKPTADKRWKDALDKATAEASKYKKELREKQTETERIEAERREADEKKDALLKSLMQEKTIAEHKANFLKEGYSEELANESATALVNNDFSTLFSNLGTFLEQREAKIKEDLIKKNPTPKGGGHITETLTKEQFDKMDLVERSKLLKEDESLYKQMIGKGE